MKGFSRIFSPKLLFSKLILLACVAILVFLAISLSRELSRRYYLESQVKSLKNEIVNLESQNQEFSQLVDYFQTQGFTEREARLKMGLKKPGEQVIIINEPGYTAGSAQDNLDIEGLANPQKWWYYFFGLDDKI
ncbi:MAG: septum formation initiator family protein [Patescibacteria group bacterium]